MRSTGPCRPWICGRSRVNPCFWTIPNSATRWTAITSSARCDNTCLPTAATCATSARTADFIVEARAGAIGTDRNDLLFGLPSTNVPAIPLVQPVPAAIPEIPIAKRKDQRGVAKIAVFAYHRATGTPVWQSGIVRQESSANDVWILGAGPFQRGTIYDGTAFAGKAIKNEPHKDEPMPRRGPAVSLSSETLFTPPQSLVKQTPSAAAPVVAQAVHQEPLPVAPAPAKVPATAAATPATPHRSNGHHAAARVRFGSSTSSAGSDDYPSQSQRRCRSQLRAGD